MKEGLISGNPERMYGGKRESLNEHSSLWAGLEKMNPISTARIQSPVKVGGAMVKAWKDRKERMIEEQAIQFG